MRYGSMKVTRMPPVHAANLAANSGNTSYGVDVIAIYDDLGKWSLKSKHPIHIRLLQLENDKDTGV